MKGQNMVEFNEILTFRVDKELKMLMAKLKEHHYNISSIARSAVYNEMKKLIKKCVVDNKEEN